MFLHTDELIVDIDQVSAAVKRGTTLSVVLKSGFAFDTDGTTARDLEKVIRFATQSFAYNEKLKRIDGFNTDIKGEN